ncbi:MAG: hypothetical protein LBM70_07395 [Victivallales bacterium]|jgi:hypothetical protein|nr:hypothetical protein [Victivallales bacterium]
MKNCPCCGALTIKEPRTYEICDSCGWEDDPIQYEDPDFAGGANELSLNQAKKALTKNQHSNGGLELIN